MTNIPTQISNPAEILPEKIMVAWNPADGEVPQRAYMLTDGVVIFEIKLMTRYEYLIEQEKAVRATDGDVAWYDITNKIIS